MSRLFAPHAVVALPCSVVFLPLLALEVTDLIVKKWLPLDPVFGFPSVDRFSWSTSTGAPLIWRVLLLALQ